MTSQSSVCEGDLRSEVMENPHEEEETQFTASNSNTNSSTAAVCSRRRLAFSRPQSTGKVNRVNPVGGGGDAESRPGNETNTATPPKAALELGLADAHKSRLCPGRKVASWNFQDVLLFYEGLKQVGGWVARRHWRPRSRLNSEDHNQLFKHGKDFEAIAKHMNKKKVNKDRDQVRNYYFNAYKIWKNKAQLEESDWAAIPRDARELFVVLNGCEWRKRTNVINFDPPKFKALILDGYTTVRTKRKKGSSIFIRTPYCPSLLRFFPYDKRYSEIPTHLNVQLTPQSYADRNYVISCEQNPLLNVKMNINDKLSSLFSLIRRKWITASQRVANSFDGGSNKSGGDERKFVLHVGEKTKIHKVQVDVNSEEGSFPTMSLRKLKRDYAVEEEMSNTIDGNSLGESDLLAAVQRQREAPDNGVGNLIKLSSVKEVFDIDEAKIKDGLTEENCGNASILQLFYFCGMRKEIMLSYEVCRRAKPAEAEPWALFLNLVSRDYGEVISKSMQGTTAPSSSSSSAMPASQMVGLLEQRSTAVVNAAPTPLSASAAGERGVMGFKPMVTAVGSSIVEEVIIVRSTVTNRDDRNEQLSGIQENMQFIRQLNELNQEPPKRKQAKRQVKLIPSARRNVDMRNIETYATPVHAGGPTIRLGDANGPIPQPTATHPVTYFLASEPVPFVHVAGSSTLVDSRPRLGENPNFATPVEATGLGTSSPSLQPTDFSQLAVEASGRVIPLVQVNLASAPASNATVQLVRPQAAHHSRTEPVANEFSMDSTLSSFINNPINLDSSPNKTLPDDVRNAYEMMLKENSVDYCKNFEQLTARIDQTTQSPKRRVLAGSSAGKKGAKGGRKRPQ